MIGTVTRMAKFVEKEVTPKLERYGKFMGKISFAIFEVTQLSVRS